MSLLSTRFCLCGLARLVEGDLLWLHPTGFDKETGAAFREQLAARPPRTRGIVLDLRGAAGGYVEVMEQIAGAFLPQDKEIMDSL